EAACRRGKRVGARKTDTPSPDLDGGDDGLARVELRHRDGETKVSLWLDESYPSLTFFTGDTQPSVDRRSLAVEPITCPPNAFQSGESIVVLEPGKSTTSVWGSGPEPPASRPAAGSPPTAPPSPPG